MNQLVAIFNSAIGNLKFRQNVAPPDYIVGSDHEKNIRAIKVRKLVDGADVSRRAVGTSGEEFGEIRLSSILVAPSIPRTATSMLLSQKSNLRA